MSRLQLAFLQVHNVLVARHEAAGAAPGDRFALAARDLRWHLQWIVLHDFLDVVVGPERAAAARDPHRRRAVAGGEMLLPVEFADAAFRYGHSQVRDRYRLRPDAPPLALFPDLAGFRPLEDAPTDWSMLFDLPGQAPAAQRCKAIDGRLVPSLIHLPVEVTGELAALEHQSLAIRDLQRGLATGLPSGEAVARHIGAPVLPPEEVGIAELGWDDETPLWFCLLKEAEVLEAGRHLGPAGSRIVSDVLVGVIDADPESYVNAEPGWTPTLASASTGFDLGALLALVQD
jgi:hypothetical protein